MNSWIFQGNPKYFDVDETLKNNDVVDWSIRQEYYLKDIKIGDEVFIWRADGGNSGSGGIVAIGKIISEPKQKIIDGEERKFVKVEIEEVRLTPQEGMLRRLDLKEDNNINHIRILTAHTGTNFKLEKKEADYLRELWYAKKIKNFNKINKKKLQLILEKFTQFRKINEEKYLEEERNYKIELLNYLNSALKIYDNNPEESKKRLRDLMEGKNVNKDLVNGLDNILSYNGFVQRDDFRILLDYIDEQKYKLLFDILFNKNKTIAECFREFREKINKLYEWLYNNNYFSKLKKKKPTFPSNFTAVLMMGYNSDKYFLYKHDEYEKTLKFLEYENLPNNVEEKCEFFVNFAKYVLQVAKRLNYDVKDLVDVHNMFYMFCKYKEMQISEEELIEMNNSFDFKDFVNSKGFNFKESILKNYILSLKSKPFVILSGISGTGKTKIAQFFAEYMCPDEVIFEDELDNISDYETIYKATKSFIKYQKITLPVNYEEIVELPRPGESKEIEVDFNGIQSTCTLGFYKRVDNSYYLSLVFKGKVKDYIKENINIGDLLKIDFSNENNIEKFTISKVQTRKKRVVKKSKRYCFISVRPDWVDNKGLLGYYNPITEEYQMAELLKLILNAKNDKENPYFVILDEMNLAKVEYYFSDFLSCLESRRIGRDGELIAESIILHDAEDEITYVDDDGIEYKIPKRITIPENVYFTGTVNIDDTTYMFSPKVLDRANVIEFNDVNLSEYRKIFDNRKTLNIVGYANKKFINEFTNEGKYCRTLIEKNFSLNDDMEQCYNHLIQINDILKEYNLHFGYRVVDEILFYIHNAMKMQYFEAIEALDYQILQRILPKFNGNRKKLELPLSQLLRYLYFGENKAIYNPLTIDDYQYLTKYYFHKSTVNNENENTIFNQSDEALFYNSSKKAFIMLKKLRDYGYTSFIE